MADPMKSSVSLVYDSKGNVIGNSQALARMLLKLDDVIGDYLEDIERAAARLSKAMEND